MAATRKTFNSTITLLNMACVALDNRGWEFHITTNRDTNKSIALE